MPNFMPGGILTGPPGPQGPPGVAAANPLTTEGDMLYWHSSAGTRLPVGTENDILVSTGTDPEWGTLATIGGLAGTTTVTLPKLTTLGSNGSLTLQNGLVTAYTPPT